MPSANRGVAPRHGRQVPEEELIPIVERVVELLPPRWDFDLEDWMWMCAATELVWQEIERERGWPSPNMDLQPLFDLEGA